MILIVSGTACVRKSSLSSKLAERLNLPNVVNVDLIHEMVCLMESDDNVPCGDEEAFMWTSQKNNSSIEQFLTRFKDDCNTVSESLTAELRKCFTEGKSLIIEGTHVNSSLLDLLDTLSEGRSQQTCLLPAIIGLFHLDWKSPEKHKKHVKDNLSHIHLIEQDASLIWSRIKAVNEQMLKERTDRHQFHTVLVDDFSKALEQMHDFVLDTLDRTFISSSSKQAQVSQ